MSLWSSGGCSRATRLTALYVCNSLDMFVCLLGNDLMDLRLIERVRFVGFLFLLFISEDGGFGYFIQLDLTFGISTLQCSLPLMY